MTNLLTLHRRKLKATFNKSVDELTTRRNADVDVNGLLQELAWTDISEVLQMTFTKIEALELNREAWEADGVIPFDRRVAVLLADDEVEEAEEAKERLLRSISREPRVQLRKFNDATLMAKHLVPRISAKVQKSLR